jgi:polyhydroxybutyrate depolymerase
MKTGLLYISLFFAFISNGQQTINASITHDNMQRDYILYVPATYDGTVAVPLLFNFHGYTSNATEQMWYGDFRPIADTAGFIVVHPQGTLDDTGTTHFNVGFGGSTTDDLGFTDALIDTLISDYMIDEDRVYSTGMSNGGFMSFHLACNLSDRIAAVASVTGSMVPITMINCNATHMTPVLQIHGTADGTVPYNGNAFMEAISDVLDHWAIHNGCSTTPITLAVPNTNTTDGSTAERIGFQDGNGCTTVLHFKVTNGGHTWPGSVFNTAGTNYDFDASKEIWNFLSQFDINGVINDCQGVGLDNNESENKIDVYPNPTNKVLQIERTNDESVIMHLTDLCGSTLIEKTWTALNETFDLRDLPNGTYFLRIENQVIPIYKIE